ncbi:hypothetical protein VIGAN_01547000 [Vigna angularis var. angularis]|uniref:Uncharacterized protein n=1 Tax=Vigna angularis var. angularis TaxID=157739 RepID=A0A0S3R9M8_PHAAN|nr:hypothetical protein VIGAN_01547000 [Vigna angularis var. angularis]
MIPFQCKIINRFVNEMVFHTSTLVTRLDHHYSIHSLLITANVAPRKLRWGLLPQLSTKVIQKMLSTFTIFI